MSQFVWVAPDHFRRRRDELKTELAMVEMIIAHVDAGRTIITGESTPGSGINVIYFTGDSTTPPFQIAP